MQKHKPEPQNARRTPPITKAIQIPPPPVQRLTPAETGGIMKRARKLGRRGVLSPYDHRLLDALLFQCGSPLSGAVVASYSALARITGIGRATIAKGIAKLIRSGLLQRIKRRLRIAWHQGGTASLQAPNAYVFNVQPAADTESTPQPVIQKLESLIISQLVSPNAESARAALALVSRRREIEAKTANVARIEQARREGRFVAC